MEATARRSPSWGAQRCSSLAKLLLPAPTGPLRAISGLCPAAASRCSRSNRGKAKPHSSEGWMGVASSSAQGPPEANLTRQSCSQILASSMPQWRSREA